MAKNKTQWGRFRVESVYYGKVKLYHVEININNWNETPKWKCIESRDYFRNARSLAKKLDAALK